MRLVIVVVVVAILLVAVAGDRVEGHQLPDLNVIATEPGLAAATNLLIGDRPPNEQSHNSTTTNRSLLCHRAELLDEYCALSSRSGDRPVCASDGRLYASACELARATCQSDGPNLCRLSDESWCRQQVQPRWCSHGAYQQFKLALWREFNSSAALLFEQLDQNRDGQLEARELWPKLSARDYDDLGDLGDSETNACDQTTTTNNQLGEFAFARHFHWSPCSLSHLLVHEQTSRPHSSSSSSSTNWQLTRAEFVRLFEEFERPRDGHGELDHPQPPAPITSELIMQMGESKLIDCLSQSGDAHKLFGAQRCAWTRHGVNLASIRNSEPHVSIVTSDNQPPRLRLIDAQLYLSGVYRCTCYGTAQDLHPNKNQSLHTVTHLVRVQVLAQPHVSVRPEFQWSLPGSRVAFECHHDHIDTSDDHRQQLEEDQIEWLVNKRPITSGNSSRISARGRHRLMLERVQPGDSGQYTCQVNAPAVRGEGSGRLLIQDQPIASFQTGQPNSQASATLLWSFHAGGVSVFRLQLPEDGQELELVRELSGQSRVSEQVDGNWNQLTLCGGLTPEQVVICEWSDNAILVEVAAAPPQPSQTEPVGQHAAQRKYVYIGQPNLNRVLVFDGRAGELVAVVATEPQPRRLFAFKPNKIHLSKWVRRRLGPLASLRWLKALEYQQQQQQQQQLANPKGHYHHLQSQAHPLGMTPKSSRLYSNRVGWPVNNNGGDDDDREHDAQDRRAEDNVPQRRFRRHLVGQRRRKWTDGQTNTNDREPVAAAAADSPQQRSSPPPPPPPPSPLPRLVQYDIWLLCYGKPLVVDAQSDLSDLPRPATALEFEAKQEEEEEEQEEGQNLIDDHRESAAAAAANHQRPGRINRLRAQKTRQRVKDDRMASQALHNQSELTWAPWPHWGSLSPLLAHQATRSKEARLRNRKSVQVIQSTFLPLGLASRSPTHHHHYNQPQSRQQRINETAGSSQTLNEFKRLTVLTTHHVIAGPRTVGRPTLAAYNELDEPYMVRRGLSPPSVAGIDLVQDLCVPERAHSQAANPKLKLHHAYVTHYAERQLYRVAMDTYRYDREIDLRQCDPLALVPAVQGLLIVQCRAPITHQLNGQLVLDELTSARVQFNAQIKAQQAHLTSDSRYLVSILANESTAQVSPASESDDTPSVDNQHTKQVQQSSVIYVQSVRVAGLKFMYEIKTSLEVAQCSFVWRDGYYAAIFVALNRRDRQTELLSLRLADGRLELIVRVPGLAWSPTVRHREPLNVNQELQVASLSTDEGLYLIDLEENRVIQGVHDHNHRLRESSLPTLQWV